jgi:hypothetical protein
MASPRLTDRDAGDETTVPLIEHEVAIWRFDELRRAGYPVDVALVLAKRHDVDLHQAQEMLERGATADQALRILS